MEFVTLKVTAEQAEMIRAALVRDALNYTSAEEARKRENLAMYVTGMMVLAQ